jgi:hypothetical protein
MVVELITSIWFQHSNGNKKDIVPTLMGITSISVLLLSHICLGNICTLIRTSS